MRVLLAIALVFWPEGTQKRNPYASWAWKQAWHEEHGAARRGSAASPQDLADAWDVCH